MGAMSGSLISYADDILVEASGAEPARSVWVWLRSQDLDTSSADDLRMLVDASGGGRVFSVVLHELGSRFKIRQNISDAVYAHAEALPPALPVLVEHLASGALFVWIDNERRLGAERSVALLKEALRWCADDYHDLLDEFQAQLEAAV